MLPLFSHILRLPQTCGPIVYNLGLIERGYVSIFLSVLWCGQCRLRIQNCLKPISFFLTCKKKTYRFQCTDVYLAVWILLICRTVGLLILKMVYCYSKNPDIIEFDWLTRFIVGHIGRASYIRIYLCYFCFRWKMVSLVQASRQHLMYQVTVSLQQSKITLQNNIINNTSITQPTLSFYLWLNMYDLYDHGLAFHGAHCCIFSRPDSAWFAETFRRRLAWFTSSGSELQRRLNRYWPATYPNVVSIAVKELHL